MASGLQIDGHLLVSDGKHDIDVTAEGSRLQVEIGNLETSLNFFQRAKIGMKFGRRLSRELDARQLTLVITRNGASLAELGAGVRSGLLARLLGLSRVRFSKRS